MNKSDGLLLSNNRSFFCSWTLSSNNFYNRPSFFDGQNVSNFFQKNQGCKNCNKELGAKKPMSPLSRNENLKVRFQDKNLREFSLSEATTNDGIRCLKEPQLFIPKIDSDLLPRFAKLFVEFDKYVFAFSSKAALNLIQPNPLIVTKNMVMDENNKFIPYFENSYTMITESFIVNNIRLFSTASYLYRALVYSLSTKKLFIKAKFIEIHDLQLSDDAFFQLLSPHLIELKCFKVTFTTLLNSIDFIERMPNIEKCLFSDRNNVSDKNLPINCKVLKTSCLPLNYLNLTSKFFMNFVEKWSKNQIKVFLCLYGLDGEFLSKFSSKSYMENLYILLTKSK